MTTQSNHHRNTYYCHDRTPLQHKVVKGLTYRHYYYHVRWSHWWEGQSKAWNITIIIIMFLVVTGGRANQRHEISPLLLSCSLESLVGGPIKGMKYHYYYYHVPCSHWWEGQSKAWNIAIIIIMFLVVTGGRANQRHEISLLLLSCSL